MHQGEARPAGQGRAATDEHREAVTVQVYAEDPVSREGIRGQLQVREDVRLLPDDGSTPDVRILAIDRLDEASARTVRRFGAQGAERLLLVVCYIDDAGLMAAVAAGVGGIVWRYNATGDELARATLTVAEDEAALPPDVVARLLTAVGRLQQRVLVPQGLTPSGLSTREVEVLRLVAEGCDTAEIADRLAYSERTIKGILHDVKTRLHLRNRTHAVWYAMREGVL
jgi:DNA-binding NarL/FixJ family response regulator